MGLSEFIIGLIVAGLILKFAEEIINACLFKFKLRAYKKSCDTFKESLTKMYQEVGDTYNDYSKEKSNLH